MRKKATSFFEYAEIRIDRYQMPDEHPSFDDYSPVGIQCIILLIERKKCI